MQCKYAQAFAFYTNFLTNNPQTFQLIVSYQGLSIPIRFQLHNSIVHRNWTFCSNPMDTLLSGHQQGRSCLSIPTASKGLLIQVCRRLKFTYNVARSRVDFFIASNGIRANRMTPCGVFYSKLHPGGAFGYNTLPITWNCKCIWSCAYAVATFWWPIFYATLNGDDLW